MDVADYLDYTLTQSHPPLPSGEPWPRQGNDVVVSVTLPRRLAEEGLRVLGRRICLFWAYAEIISSK